MTRFIAKLVFIATLITSAGCGNGYEIDVSTLNEQWQYYNSGLVTVHFPADSPRTSRMQIFADNLEEIRAEVTRIFQVDTSYAVDAYLFTTNGDCVAVTGRDAGFADGNHAFYRIGAALGGPLTLAVTNAIDPDARSFHPLKEGLLFAFDYTGTNYDSEALQLKEAGQWVPLSQLIDEDSLTPESQRQVLRASFVSYLIRVHGMFRFHQIWRSVLPLNETLREILGGSLDEIDTHWQQWVEQAGKEE